MENLPPLNKPIFYHFLGPDWYSILKDIFESDSFHQIGVRLMRERGTGLNIIPAHEKIHLAFRAFRECNPKDLKIIILGQDPYPQPGVFDGLAFSNGNSQRASPSLRTILSEIERTEYPEGYPEDDDINRLDLTRWAKQGILLLNTALTVVAGSPESHTKLWEPFTAKLIARLTETTTGLIFLLWGRKAQMYESFISNKDFHHILKAGHPSPLNSTNPFYGCGIFSEANDLIRNMNGQEFTIKW